jgi:hypothetical protein
LSTIPSGNETSIRQLIANGKSKTALDSAKDFHRKQNNAASEALLIDAYIARIQALSAQNLAVEAKSLIATVRDRFPAAKEKLDSLNAATSARGGQFDELLAPLNDPQITTERRAAIELLIRNQVTDLAALAACTVLPADHPLRKAAAAIDAAFGVVTSGPVSDEQIALAEVSHRSPLAPWKLLIRAIACFYRDQDEKCEEYLSAVRPESAPGRLVKALRAAMSGAGSGERRTGDLKPAEAVLVSRTTVGLDKVRGALSRLDKAFIHEETPGPVIKAVRDAVRECRQGAPDLLPALRQAVAVNAVLGNYDPERMIVALEGAPRKDAAFFRDIARALEHTGDSLDLLRACEYWDMFREEALIEGWFSESGPEAAALYLHMAGVLGKLDPRRLAELRRSTGKGKTPAYFVVPGELYARAAAIDPHRETYAQWMAWARRNSVGEGESVARIWNQALPSDIEPLLYLMAEAEKRNAFPTALSYLDKAEKIDGVNPTVRTARLRLLAAAALGHLKKKKPHLALQRLAEMTSLPQSRQGDRPAFLAVLDSLIRYASGDKPGGEEALRAAGRLLDDEFAARILFVGCAMGTKLPYPVFLPLRKDLTKEQATRLPASMVQVIALARDMGITEKLQSPFEYFDEIAAQFSRAAGSLDIEQIRALGEMGMNTEHPRLAWEASAAGLNRGGPSEAYFLLLRARATPEDYRERREVLAAAAAELGRFHRDMEVVSHAVEAGRDPFGDDPLTLTAEQAREVLRKEKASPEFPTGYRPGPDYGDLFDDGVPCMCPDCRAKRGESFGPAYEDTAYEDTAYEDPAYEDPAYEDPALEEPRTEADFEKMVYGAVPKDMPRELVDALIQMAKQAFLAGQSPDEFMSGFLGGPGRGKKKGKRRK